MNIPTILDNKQELSRTVKGYDIFNAQLIDHISKREYLIKDKYIVEDLTTKDDIEPIYRCSCPDYSYRGVQCAHIIAVQFYILDGV